MNATTTPDTDQVLVSRLTVGMVMFYPATGRTAEIVTVDETPSGEQQIEPVFGWAYRWINGAMVHRAAFRAVTRDSLASAAPFVPVRLCDPCWESATGDPAQCEDGCALSLDHNGLCDRKQRPNAQQQCDRCGTVGRLHTV